MEHLWSEKGCKGIPLAYVVVSQRPKTEPEDKPVKYDAVYSTKRTGVAYKQDRQRVWHLLQSNLTLTCGWAWIAEFAMARDGREAFIALDKRFGGAAMETSNKMEAERILNEIKWDGDSTKPLAEVIDQMKEAFNILEENGIKEWEGQKVNYLLQALPQEYRSVLGIKVAEFYQKDKMMDFEYAAGLVLLYNVVHPSKPEQPRREKIRDTFQQSSAEERKHVHSKNRRNKPARKHMRRKHWMRNVGPLQSSAGRKKCAKPNGKKRQKKPARKHKQSKH